MKENQVNVSVLIPTYNEEKYIGRTIDTLLNNNYPENLFEIIVIDGGSTDSSVSIINEKIKENYNIKIYDNPRKIQSIGLNIGIEKSKGDIIIRADAHALYDRNFILESVTLLQNNNYYNVGPFQKSVGSDVISNSIAMAMNSFFGLGNAKYRFSDHYLEHVKSVWLGAWWKEKIIQLNGFDESLKIAEDFDLNYRIRAIGGEIVASNKIKATYIVRKSVFDLFKQFYKYGFWKMKFLLKFHSEIQIRWLAPPILVLSMIISSIMAISYDFMLIIPLFYFIFLFVGVLFNFKIKTPKKILSSLFLFIIYPTLHFSWGIGFIMGLIYWNIVKSDKNIK